jgi:hypothetical protein
VLYARNLTYLLPIVTVLAAQGLTQLFPNKRGLLALLLLLLLGFTIWNTRQIDSPTAVDRALSYLQTQSTSTTVILGCCVNEPAWYTMPGDVRLLLRPDTQRLLVIFEPDFDALDNIIRSYGIDDLVGDCVDEKKYEGLNVYRCQYNRQASPAP